MNYSHVTPVTNTVPVLRPTPALFWKTLYKEAFDQGVNARLSGFSSDVNPYKDIDLQRTFLLGYDYAFDVQKYN